MKVGYVYIIRNNVNNKVYIGQTKRTVESAAAAAKEIKITTDASIIRCCQGKYITAGGFKWKYKND